MKAVVVFCVVSLAAFCSAQQRSFSKPKVQVYSRNPGEYGKENVLICRVGEFYPPDLRIQLLRDGVEMPTCDQTDLTFRKDWRFHLIRSKEFVPTSGEQYICRVTHGNSVTNYVWEPNM